jgi:hypothetical protein
VSETDGDATYGVDGPGETKTERRRSPDWLITVTWFDHSADIRQRRC